MKNHGHKSEIIIDLRNNSHREAVVKEIRSTTPCLIKGKDGVYTISIELSQRSGKQSRRAAKSVHVKSMPKTNKTRYVDRIAESCGLLLEQTPEKSVKNEYPRLILAQE